MTILLGLDSAPAAKPQARPGHINPNLTHPRYRRGGPCPAAARRGAHCGFASSFQRSISGKTSRGSTAAGSTMRLQASSGSSCHRGVSGTSRKRISWVAGRPAGPPRNAPAAHAPDHRLHVRVREVENVLAVLARTQQRPQRIRLGGEVIPGIGEVETRDLLQVGLQGPQVPLFQAADRCPRPPAPGRAGTPWPFAAPGRRRDT